MVATGLTVLKVETRGQANNTISPGNKGLLDIRVSPENLSRSLRIMDSIIKAFWANGLKIGQDPEKYSGSYVRMLGEKIFFSIDEKVKRIDHVPTKKRKRNKRNILGATGPNMISSQPAY